jgi:membrane protein YdbS with pleckstrin-like domain
MTPASDSSKDLEKDEREWIFTATKIRGHEPEHEVFPLIADGALSERIKVVPKARLQQVEADIEPLVNTLQRLLKAASINLSA